ncbi:MAG: VOC family protein [Raoultibacter sp.]|jgi:catechol 2,3-dioxygenase-like lactoylglutathione lyase family enzyme
MSNHDVVKITDLFKEVVQIGIVVPDIEKTKAAMKDVFDLEPDAGGEYVYKKCLYKDEIIDAPVHAAFYNYFNVQLELLEPIGDQKTVWSDYLEMGMSGLHHIRFDVEDHDKANELMAEKGIGIWMEGTSLINPESRFTYYDSMDKLGFIVEAVTKAK